MTSLWICNHSILIISLFFFHLLLIKKILSLTIFGQTHSRFILLSPLFQSHYCLLINGFVISTILSFLNLLLSQKLIHYVFKHKSLLFCMKAIELSFVLFIINAYNIKTTFLIEINGKKQCYNNFSFHYLIFLILLNK